MQERLQWILHQPKTWLDWHPSRGGLDGHALVAKRYPHAQSYVYEEAMSGLALSRKALTGAWWNPARWGKMAPRFGWPGQPVDMLWANMVLHMAADPQALLARWYQTLATGGFTMFSCLGPDTLRELRAVYASAGWAYPHHQFIDMHDLGDMMVQAGFAEPVMDMERITLSYSSPQHLLNELRTLGRNLHVQRFSGLRTPSWRNELHRAVDGQRAGAVGQGRLHLTFEIVYGHAFKPPGVIKLQSETRVPLEQMRATLIK